MNERDFNKFTDKEFEEFLQQKAAGFNVSEKIVKSVNPWKKSTSMILAGFILQIFILKFFYIDYILPLVGAILIALGFRMLSNENKWFKAGTIIAFVKCGVTIVYDVFKSVLCTNVDVQKIVFLLMKYLSMGAILALIVCLWGGFRQVQKKAGVAVHTASLACLFFLYLFFSLFPMINIHLVYVLIFYPVAIIITLICFYKIIKEISASGYAICPKDIKIPNWAIMTLLLLTAIVGVFIGNFFFTSYPMDFKAVEVSDTAESLTVKQQLLEMNFPEEFINDLTEKDLEDCRDPVRIVAFDKVLDRRSWIRDLRLQTVFVQTSAEDETWKIFYFFSWAEPPKTYRADSVHFDPVYNESPNVFWEKIGDITGKVFYDNDGVTYSSPYYSLEEIIVKQKNTENYLFAADHSSCIRRVIGEMSFPAGGENYRGYVSYSVKLNGELNPTNSYFAYSHSDAFVYPFEEKSNYWRNSNRQSDFVTAYTDFIFSGSNLYWYYDQDYIVVDR